MQNILLGYCQKFNIYRAEAHAREKSGGREETAGEEAVGGTRGEERKEAVRREETGGGKSAKSAYAMALLQMQPDKEQYPPMGCKVKGEKKHHTDCLQPL